MSLKTWNKHEFTYTSLVDGSTDLWTLSSSGTNEYYYNSQILFEPVIVLEDGTEISYEEIGSLTAGNWGFGDNDSLGYDTLYIRLSDSGDPDAKANEYIQTSLTHNILTAESSKECILLSMLFSNYSLENDAEIYVLHTDSSNNIKFKWYINLLSTNSPFALDSKIIVSETDKIYIISSIEKLSVLLSGDES